MKVENSVAIATIAVVDNAIVGKTFVDRIAAAVVAAAAFLGKVGFDLGYTGWNFVENHNCYNHLDLHLLNFFLRIKIWMKKKAKINSSFK